MKVKDKATFTTVRAEGAILPADLLQRIIENDKHLEGLKPTTYHLLEGEKLNEAINRSWTRLRGAWVSFQTALEKLSPNDPGTSVTRDRLLLPLFQELGYGRLTSAKALEIEDRSYPISHGWQHTPIHLVGWRVDLDHRTAGVAGAARSSPHSLVQEVLNRSQDHLWAFLSNGRQLRILRDNVSLTRQAYVEFDLEAMMAGEVYADFVLLWLLCHQSRVEAEKPEQCWLEKWSKTAQEQGTRALDQLRQGVKGAIGTLGQGFLSHPDNRELRQKLQSGELSTQDYYRQLLRLVYRLLFLFVAEDRGLLLDLEADGVARERYTLYYSTARLRMLAEKRRGTRHCDLFFGLRLVMEKLGSSEGYPALGLPALGSLLWSNEFVPDLMGVLPSSPSPFSPREKGDKTLPSPSGRGAGGEGQPCQITNADLLEAIRALAFINDKHSRRPVDYKNLRSEELGSVYEALLELHPELNVGAGTFLLTTAAGNERKTTGSYYTPESLVQCLLDSALDPVVDEAVKNALTPQPPLPRGEGEQEEGEQGSKWDIPVATQKKMQEVAQQLRRRSTQSEVILWEALRNRRLEGRKFRRQHPIGTFVVDFFCKEEGLIVEIDGAVHESQQSLDRQRQELLESLGLRFVRISSVLVETDLSTVLETIRQSFLPSSPSPFSLGEKGDKTSILPSPSGRGVGGEGINPAEQAILNLKVCDPACGSGHFLIAAAHRMAKRLATIRTGDEEPSPEATQKALRDVIGRCIYGVDVNPMAVELCKVALWMESLEPGRPLSFLEHHIQCGNSLLGATPALLRKGIPDEAFTPIEGDDKAYCSKFKKQNKEERSGQLKLFDANFEPWQRLGDLATSLVSLDQIADHSIEGIQRKQEQYETLVKSTPYLFSQFWADAWCAAFVWKKTQEFPYPITDEVFRRIERNPYSVETWMRDEVVQLAEEYKFFHWHLAFPDVFQVSNEVVLEHEQVGWNGGFDSVLGNPPWIRQELLDVPKSLLTVFESFKSTADSSVFFLDRSLHITRQNCRVGMLTPNKWFRADYAEELRRILREQAKINVLIDFGHSKTLFPDADTFPAAIIFGPVTCRMSNQECLRFVQAHDSNRKKHSLAELISRFSIEVPYGNLCPNRWLLEDQEVSQLLARLLQYGKPLSNVLPQSIFGGLKTGFNDAFYIDSAKRNIFIEEDPNCSSLIRKLVRGRDIQRWKCEWDDQWHIIIPSSQNFTWPWSYAKSEGEAEAIFEATYPVLYQHFKSFKNKLQKRSDKGKFWWELRACDYYEEFDKSKIIVQCIAYYSRFALDNENHVINNKAIIIPSHDPYLLTVLNSRIMWWIIYKTFQHMKDDGLSIDVQFLVDLPIPAMDCNKENVIRAKSSELIKVVQSEPENLSKICYLEVELNSLIEEAFEITENERKTLLRSLPPRDPIVTLEHLFPMETEK
jgi:very-short-patch-repair endonuclease